MLFGPELETLRAAIIEPDRFGGTCLNRGCIPSKMLVVTADRPPALRDVGAPQTIDQTNLYGRSVRWFHDPGVPDDSASASWRSLARRSIDAARAGPVHLNLPFREPLLGQPGELPPRLTPSTSADATILAGRVIDGLDGIVNAERGLILAGGRGGVAPDEVDALAAATGWPILADPISGCRSLDRSVTAFDAVLRSEQFAAGHRPDVVIRVGRPAASKVLATWITAGGAPLVQVGGPGVIDPDHRVAVHLPASSMAELRDDYSIIIVTHNMQQAARVADRTAFFTALADETTGDRTGLLVEYDLTTKIFSSPSDDRTEKYITGRFG